MDLKEVGKTFASVGLKVLGTAIGGPAGATVADMAARALGLDSSDPESLAAAVAADPQAVIKLKDLEANHEIELQKLILQGETARLADVASARQMNVETTKATGKRDTNLYVLAWVITFGFFALVGILIFVQLPKDSTGVVFMLFGSLASGFTGIVGYFFGSSKGSADKTALLAQAQPIGSDRQ